MRCLLVPTYVRRFVRVCYSVLAFVRMCVLANHTSMQTRVNYRSSVHSCQTNKSDAFGRDCCSLIAYMYTCTLLSRPYTYRMAGTNLHLPDAIYLSRVL